jgi:peptidase C25-like protein
MTTTKRTPRRGALVRRSVLCATGTLALVVLGAHWLAAAGTPATSTTPNTASQLVTVQGSATTLSQGDYVSSAAGLGQRYRYYIEVPPSLTRLVVDLFDADVLASASDAADERDRPLAMAASCVQYTLRNPSGTAVRQVVKGNGNCVATINDNSGDNAWANFYDSATHSTTPSWAATTQSVAGFDTGGLNLIQPTGTVAGSFLLAHIVRDGDGATSGSITPGNATWIELDQQDCTGGSCRAAVFYRIAGATEPGAYTFTWTGFSEQTTGVILRYANVDPVVPVNGFAVAAGTSSSPTAPSLATTVANTRLVRLFSADNTSNVCPNSVATQRYCLESDASAAGSVSSAGADAALAAAGSSGTASFSLGAAESWRALTIALNGTPTNVTPTNGHWELTVDTSSTVTSGDALNAFGLRAHNGDASSGGTELPVYAESFHAVGINANARSRTYDLYPYVTSGCEVDVDDFDFDDDQPAPGGGNPNLAPFGSHQLTRGGGGYTFTSSGVSNDGAWLSTVVGDGVTENWPGSPTQATGYGLWTQTTTIEDYGAGNSAVLYLASSSAASPPPTAQPEAGSLRTYLPADGGGAPVKPYMVQSLTCVTNCTPAVGVTTRVRIDVLVVNPTTRPIVFSTPTNIVTANVPGPGGAVAPFVVYAGGATASSGAASLTGQPAVGGIGNVTWNPGIVAAGATAWLSYQVNARPSSVGQVLAVTGTPASNGTRGRWLDETAATGAAATRATTQFGGLCQLSITSGETITPALVSDLWVEASGTSRVVTWRTSSELDTVAFDLLRRDPSTGRLVKLNERPIPAAVDSPLGATYRFEDASGPATAASSYVLRALDVGGHARELGPFRAVLPPASAAPASAAAVTDEPRRNRIPESLWQAERDLQRAHGAGEPARPAAEPVVAAKLGVRTSGLHSVTSERIAGALGVGEDEVVRRIASGELALSQGGRAVAWRGSADGRSLLFYGEESSSLYSRDNVYVLRPGPGLAMRSLPAPLVGPPGGDRFVSTVRAEVDAFAAIAVATDPEADYWYWRVLLAGDPTFGRASFTLDAPDLAPSAGEARLSVDLFGATTTGAAEEHHILLRVNGVQVGAAVWTGKQPRRVDLALPPGLLAPGPNTLELQAVLAGEAPISVVYLDDFELTYERLYSAVADELELTADDPGVVTVRGFTSPDVLVLDLTTSRLPAVVATAPAGDGAVRLRASRPGSRLLAVGPTAVRSPAWIRPDFASGLRSRGSGAPYVVITTSDLLDAAQALADARARQGLAALVVDVDDVYDEWSDGQPTPHAIRAFVRHAATRWQEPLRYLALAGAGSFDYRDRFGLGGNLLPPMLAVSPSGLFASDNQLGDLDDDGVPEVAVGRLPVETPAELSAYVEKLVAVEARADEASEGRFLLTADDGEAAVSFAARSEALAGSLPPGFVERRVYLDPGALGDRRQALFAALAEGTDFVSYVGHGGMDRLAAEGLLLAADAATLPAGERLPVVVGLTCLINRFEHPGIEPLGSALVLAPGRGAVAVWSASGISDNDAAQRLGETLLPMLGRGGERLGDLVRRTLRAGRSPGLPAWTLRTFELLGDPALLLAAPPRPSGPAAGAGAGG